MIRDDETPTTEPREQAFAALYQADQIGDVDLSELTGRAARLVDGTLEHLAEIDAAIEEASDNWRVDRMPAVDRAILRLAVFELRHEEATPTAVVLAEAVRIAKTYSTQNSGRFVNGVLATLATRLR